MKKNIKGISILCVVILSFLIGWMSLLKLAVKCVCFQYVPANVMVNSGIKNVDTKICVSNRFFSVFPFMLSPAVKKYLENKPAYDKEIVRSFVTLQLPFANQPSQSCIEEILKNLLKNGN